MAEAHAIAHLRDEVKRGVSLDMHEDGYDVRIQLTLPNLPVLRRSVLRSVFRFRNTVKNLIFPVAPLLSLALVVGTLALVLAAERSSWLRDGFLAHALWEVSFYVVPLHFSDVTPRVAVLALLAAVVGVLLIALAQRFTLRLLLSWNGWLYAAHGKTPVLHKAWGVLVKICRGAYPLTFSFQPTLPSLPLPSLRSTVRRYLESMAPLQTAEERLAAEEEAAAFLEGEGPLLQRYLWAKWAFSRNYVTDWWEKYVYLRGRPAILINSNYYVVDGLAEPKTTIRAHRAAAVTHAILGFKTLVDREQLEPLSLRGVVPLCMEQYRRLFSTTRLAGRSEDTLRRFPDSRHVSVQLRGHFFTFSPYAAGKLLSPAAIATEFERIERWVDDHGPADGLERLLPALTAGDRTRWARAREEGLSEGLPQRALRAVESAIFHVVLDDTAPTSLNDRARSLLHGDGTSRWCDKSFTLVAFANGRAGLNAEHSWADAPVVAHMWEHALVTERKTIEYDAAGRLLPSGAETRPVKAVRHLDWALDPRGPVAAAAEEAVSEVSALIRDIDVQVLHFSGYGKGFMKRLGVSPDAYIQLAFQLAYLRRHGKFALTYESAMTRLFHSGRTETVRPVTAASCAFARAFAELEPATASPADRKRVLQLFSEASDRHQDRYRDAMAGAGCDRHLFALYVVSVGKEIDSPFLKRALSQPWRLSTSQQPQQQTKLWDMRKETGLHCPGGGFGPVSDDGYGVSYMITGENEFFMHISSKKSCALTDSEEFSAAIAAAFDDMKTMFENAK